MPEIGTAAHQADVDQRHAAARTAATALVRAAAPAVLDRGLDIRRASTVLDFGATEGAEQIMKAAPCGDFECVLAASVMLVSELALRLASQQVTADTETNPNPTGGAS